MAVTTPIRGPSAPPPHEVGRPPTPPRRSWLDRLLAAIDSLKSTAAVVADVERVGPYQSVEVARRWLERQ